MGVMYCEYYKDKVLPEGQPPIARGKVVWLNQNEMQRDCPACVYLFQKPFVKNEEELSSIKEMLQACLTKKGFIFFDECVYRYTLYRNGMLKDIGINFHHIR